MKVLQVNGGECDHDADTLLCLILRKRYVIDDPLVFLGILAWYSLVVHMKMAGVVDPARFQPGNGVVTLWRDV